VLRVSDGSLLGNLLDFALLDTRLGLDFGLLPDLNLSPGLLGEASRRRQSDGKAGGRLKIATHGLNSFVDFGCVPK